MSSGDLTLLQEMGFEQARAELALKKGGCQYLRSGNRFRDISIFAFLVLTSAQCSRP